VSLLRWGLLPFLAILSACGRGYPEEDQQMYALESMHSEVLLDKLNRYAKRSDGVQRGGFDLVDACRLDWREGSNKNLRGLPLTKGYRVSGGGRDGHYLVGVQTDKGEVVELFVLADWTESIVARDVLRELIGRCQHIGARAS